MKKRIAAVGLACPTEMGFEHAAELYKITVRSLADQYDVLDTGVIVTNPSDLRHVQAMLHKKTVDALLVCAATWSEDQHILRLLHSLRCTAILHAFPSIDSGSLCTVQQIASVLTDIHYPAFTGFCAKAGSEEALAHIRRAMENAKPSASPRGSMSIGAIGGRVQGMTEIAYDEFALLEKCGALIVPIGETELLDLVDAVTDEELAAARERLAQRRFIRLSGSVAIDESLRYYLAMKALVRRYDLQGLAVKCYTRYMGRVCLGYSLLSDEGIVCSCEGDVTNAVMMRILADLTGQCVNHTDFLYPDEKTNSALFSHCGGTGFSLAKPQAEIELAPVRLMERGVCCRFLPKGGIVTLADLVGHGDKLRMSVLTGEAIDCAMEFPGTPMRVRFQKPVWEINAQIIERGCGHHWMIGYGDVAAELAEYCRQNGIVFQRIGI